MFRLGGACALPASRPQGDLRVQSAFDLFGRRSVLVPRLARPGSPWRPSWDGFLWSQRRCWPIWREAHYSSRFCINHRQGHVIGLLPSSGDRAIVCQTLSQNCCAEPARLAPRRSDPALRLQPHTGCVAHIDRRRRNTANSVLPGRSGDDLFVDHRVRRTCSAAAPGQVWGLKVVPSGRSLRGSS